VICFSYLEYALVLLGQAVGFIVVAAALHIRRKLKEERCVQQSRSRDESRR
jgi:hypothetical protein